MEEEQSKQAPFNMALDTLQIIRRMINDIAMLSIGFLKSGYKLPPGEAQHAKYYAVEQLIIVASPLLKDKQNEKIQNEFEKIKLTELRIYPQNGVGNPKKTEGYNYNTDKELNKIVKLVQRELQVEGHFMPSKGEDSLF